MAQTDRQTDSQADRQTDRQTDRQSGRQTDRQTDSQEGRQADRQTGRQGRQGRQAVISSLSVPVPHRSATSEARPFTDKQHISKTNRDPYTFSTVI
jgi:hypothetical protein